MSFLRDNFSARADAVSHGYDREYLQRHKQVEGDRNASGILGQADGLLASVMNSLGRLLVVPTYFTSRAQCGSTELSKVETVGFTVGRNSVGSARIKSKGSWYSGTQALVQLAMTSRSTQKYCNR